VVFLAGSRQDPRRWSMDLLWFLETRSYMVHRLVEKETGPHQSFFITYWVAEVGLVLGWVLHTCGGRIPL
jgi:hypothetical protein